MKVGTDSDRTELWQLPAFHCARRASAGCTVEEIGDTPPIDEAADIQARQWLGDDFTHLTEAVAQDGDAGAAAVVAGVRPFVEAYPADVAASTCTCVRAKPSERAELRQHR